MTRENRVLREHATWLTVKLCQMKEKCQNDVDELLCQELESTTQRLDNPASCESESSPSTPMLTSRIRRQLNSKFLARVDELLSAIKIRQDHALQSSEQAPKSLNSIVDSLLLRADTSFHVGIPASVRSSVLQTPTPTRNSFSVGQVSHQPTTSLNCPSPSSFIFNHSRHNRKTATTETEVGETQGCSGTEQNNLQPLKRQRIGSEARGLDFA